MLVVGCTGYIGKFVTLELVRRVPGERLGLPPEVLPADGKVEVSLLGAEELARLSRDTPIDLD